jgi:hypothetical protein
VEEAAAAQERAAAAAAAAAVPPSLPPDFGLQQPQPQHQHQQQQQDVAGGLAPTTRLLQELAAQHQSQADAATQQVPLLYHRSLEPQAAPQLPLHQHYQHQQAPQQVHQQQAPPPQDAGAFFKSLFPSANVSVANASTGASTGTSFHLGLHQHQASPPQQQHGVPVSQAHQQPHQYQLQQPHLHQHYQHQQPQYQLAPPLQQAQQQHHHMAGPPPAAYGTAYGGGAGGGSALFGAGPGGAQLGSSPPATYNPIADMFSQHQQQPPSLAPGLALLRQLQGGSAAVGTQVQQQQVGGFSGGFVDPAIMAVGARQAAAPPPPPGFATVRPPGY